MSALGGQDIFKELTFPVNRIEIENYKGYVNVRLPDFELTSEVGAPEIPVFPLYVYLPKGARVLRVDTVKTIRSEYRLKNPVKPSQPPVILSKATSPLKFVPPNPQIYTSLNPYPGKLIDFISQGNLSDTTVAEILIYPVQYIPSTKKLLLYSKIEIRVRYRIESLPLPPPEPDKGFEYLIVTTTAFDTIFERLAEWKTKKGIPAVVRRIEDVTRSSQGVDDQERIRNYLKAACKDSGLKWLLLGGDVQLIPLRYAFAMVCSSGMEPQRNEDWLPCDLYYSDLDGTWDANHNRIYGEVEDSVDLYPDIWVGRAPVENIIEAQAFVDKTLLYERSPPLDYQNRLLFLGDILWQNPYTDAGVAKDMIDNRHIPDYVELTKLYRSKGNENRETVISAMEQGYNIINHDGHGWIVFMGVGEGGLLNEDAASLTNSPRNSIIFSIGCWTGAFDFNDCIGEEFIKNREGGGVAYIGNSSYGWGSPGNPGYGYSDRFDEEFYRRIYRDSIFELGRVLGMDKMHFIGFSRDQNVYRFHQYQLNLFGDPELSVWTDIPDTLQVFYPPSIPEEGGKIRVVVSHNNRPVKGARVCLWKEGEIYLIGFTSDNGEVSFSLPHISGGKIYLTVTAHNFLPFEKEIEVITKGPYLDYVDKKVKDDGNQDGIANPGEEIFLSLLFKNQGKESAKNIYFRLKSENPYVDMIDDTDYLKELKTGDSLWIEDGFRFKLSEECPDKEVIYFTLIVGATNYSGVFHPSIIVGRPDLYIYKIEMTDSLGNRNHIIEPSAEVLIRVWLKNRGFGNGYNTWARLISKDPQIVVDEDSAGFETVMKDSTKESSNLYKVKVLAGCPVSYHSYLTLRISTSGGSAEETFQDSLLLMVGRVGLSEDVEGGADGWEMGGEYNLWHISTHNSHSSSHSFYCGSESTGAFFKNSEEWLISPPFVIGEDFVLSFWRRFVLPIYGTAGLYVEVYPPGADEEWDIIDFIGSGGALGKLEVSSEWAKERYELNYPVGETLRIRFRFVSDEADPTEGFYIDDILVGRRLGLVEEKSDLTERPFSYSLTPNPAKEKAEIRFEIGDRGYELPIDLTIYDAMGRKVRLLAKIQSPEPRAYTLSWDGRNDKGEVVPSGIYFSVLRINNRRFSKKIVLVNSH